MKWETFIKHRDRLDGQVYLALEDGTRCADHATAATCAGLLERYDNAAERALRHPVIAKRCLGDRWKQLRFGTPSDSGSRFVETLLTVLETCRPREKNTFDFLTQAITAHFAHQKPPSLLARVGTVTFDGVLVSDYYAAYGRLEADKQKCLTHLLRELHTLRKELPRAAVDAFIQPVMTLFQDAIALGKQRDALTPQPSTNSGNSSKSGSTY